MFIIECSHPYSLTVHKAVIVKSISDIIPTILQMVDNNLFPYEGKYYLSSEDCINGDVCSYSEWFAQMRANLNATLGKHHVLPSKEYIENILWKCYAPYYWQIQEISFSKEIRLMDNLEFVEDEIIWKDS